MKDIQINLAVAGLVIGLLSSLGAALKRVPWVANHYIPFLLGIAGGVLYPAIEGWTALNGAIGFACAWGQTGLHQWVKQGLSVRQGPVAKPASAPGARASLLIWCLVPWFVFVGCKTPTGDPVAVRAEQTIQASFTTVDTFLAYEHSQRNLPGGVQEAADTLRTQYPPVHRAALDALASYKRNRDAYATDTLNRWLATLLELAAIAARARTELN